MRGTIVRRHIFGAMLLMCGCWVVIISFFVRLSFSDTHNNYILDSIENTTDGVKITSDCRLFLKLLLKDLVRNGTWDADKKSDSYTRCYDIECSEASVKARCYLKFPIQKGNGNVSSNWTINLKPEDGLNTTTHLRVTNENVTNDFLASTVCLPISCSNDDITNIFNDLKDKEASASQSIENSSPTPNAEIIFAVVVLSWFIFMMLLSTLYDLYCYAKRIEPLHECLVAFSVCRNGKRIFSTTRCSSDMPCLDGIRVVSMTWVIVLHASSEMCKAYFYGNEEVIKWESTWGSMLLKSGTLAVDSFLLVGGTLMAYTFMSKRTKLLSEKFSLIRHYLHRYIRLTPPLAAAVLVSAVLLNNAGSPEYRETLNSVLSTPCKKYWWSVLLYVQNYVNVKDLCLSQTWYLSTDMQLYLISPLILLPLWKKPKLGLTILVISIQITIVVPFCIAYHKRLTGMQGIIAHDDTMEEYNQYLYEYYFRTHTRSTPWFMGMLLGYILYAIKYDVVKKPRINKVALVLLWSLCLALLLVCIFGGHTLEAAYTRGASYNRLRHSMFIALAKPAWSLCLAWVIFACTLGYGGPINWMLSNSVNKIFIRFTYSMYIIHMPVILVANYTSDGEKSFSVFNMLGASCIVFIASFGISIVWVLAFESPIMILEKHILAE